jgi:hypothetical protein
LSVAAAFRNDRRRSYRHSSMPALGCVRHKMDEIGRVVAGYHHSIAKYEIWLQHKSITLHDAAGELAYPDYWFDAYYLRSLMSKDRNLPERTPYSQDQRRCYSACHYVILHIGRRAACNLFYSSPLITAASKGGGDWVLNTRALER